MDLGGIVSIEMIRAKGSQLPSGFFSPLLSSVQSLQCFPISIEIRGTLERILLEAIRIEKMKREKEIEVPTPPRGKQDNEHVIMYYTKKRGEENSMQSLRKKNTEFERDRTVGGGKAYELKIG